MKRFSLDIFRPAVGVRFLRPDHGRGEPGREQADAGASENHPHTALHHDFRHRILRCAALPAGLAVGSARWRRPFQLPAPQFHQRIPPCDLVLRHDPRSRTPQRSPLHPPCGIFPCQLDFRHHPAVRRRALTPRLRRDASTTRTFRPNTIPRRRSWPGAAAGACSGQRGPGGLRQYQNRRRCDLRRRPFASGVS